jgi:hypothetical protein
VRSAAGEGQKLAGHLARSGHSRPSPTSSTVGDAAYTAHPTAKTQRPRADRILLTKRQHQPKDQPTTSNRPNSQEPETPDPPPPPTTRCCASAIVAGEH